MSQTRTESGAAMDNNSTNQGAAVCSAKHILLVEDDAMVREHVECLLEDLGYKVTSAHNARECLRVISDLDRVDLLFSDIVMPGGMSGTQLAREIRQMYPVLPILLTSGYAEDVISGLDSTDARLALLRKPYRRTDLCRALQAMLG